MFLVSQCFDVILNYLLMTGQPFKMCNGYYQKLVTGVLVTLGPSPVTVSVFRHNLRSFYLKHNIVWNIFLIAGVLQENNSISHFNKFCNSLRTVSL